MHYDIKYDTSSPDAPAKALKDCEAFLGRRQFLKVIRTLRNTEQGHNRRFVIMCVGLQGIQGYPAEVMVDTYYKGAKA